MFWREYKNASKEFELFSLFSRFGITGGLLYFENLILSYELILIRQWTQWSKLLLQTTNLFVYFRSQIASMDYYRRTCEWERLHGLAMDIQWMKCYLSDHRNRENLSVRQRADLIRIQIKMFKMINDLKMMARKCRRVPQSVLMIYYWPNHVFEYFW